MESEKLIIDWSQLPTYNTIMALFVGISLISIAKVGKALVRNTEVNPIGWALNFAALGLVLTITGAHMTLTWPLAKYFPFDNILFGEPTFAFGVLDIILAFYFWKNASQITLDNAPVVQIAKHFTPFSILLYGLALMLVSIFFAGVDFQFFAAPKEEPISGNFADYPWLEAWGLSLIFLGIGASSFLTGMLLPKLRVSTYQINILDKLNYLIFMLTGWFMLLFGAMNYYTHIGLILNTMK